MGRTKRFLCHAVLFFTPGTQFLSFPSYGEALPEEMIPGEPLVSSNEAMSTGQETIWDCVCFGSYPSAEVVQSGWDAVDDYAVLDGDVIRDDQPYNTLAEADWEGDRLILNGQDYVRISGEDAVTASAGAYLTQTL